MRRICLFVIGGLLVYHQLGLCVDARTARVTSPVELRRAFDDHNVDRIFLLDSMYLREYNGWNLNRDGPIRLNRSVVVEGDTQWNRLIALDFDTILMNNQKFFEPEVEGLTLTFIELHLAGLPTVQGSPDSYRANMSYIFEHCLLEVYYPAQGSAPDWPAWIDLERAQEYPANFETGQQQLIRPEEKEFCDMWCDIECPDAIYVYMKDAAFYFGSVNPKVAEEFGFNVEETGILRYDDTMMLLVGLDERTPNTTEAFEAALQSTDGHRTVVIVDNYLKLWRSRLQCDAQLQRNTIIRGSSNNVPPLSLLDFNLITNCTSIPDGVSLTIKDLLLNNSAIDAAVIRKFSPWQTVAGFFAPAAGGIVNVDNVVWHSLSSTKKPLSAGSISGDLKERGRVTMDRSDVIDTKTQQEVDTRSTEWCTSSFIGNSPSCVKNENCRKHVRCPNRAVQIGDVTYEFPSKIGPGNAFYHITGSLVIPILVESPQDLVPPDDFETNDTPGTPGEKTPVLIILILVGLGAVGFTVAAVALMLAKLRHKHAAADNSCAGSEHELDNYASAYSDLGAIGGKGSGTQALTSSKHSSINRSEMSHFSKHAQRAAEKMFGNIILGDLLGQGGFGRVYKAAWNGAVVAVKVIEIGSESPNQESSIQREVDLLLGLRHPNIVNLYQAASRPVGGRYSQESLTLKEMEDTITPGSISSGSDPPNQVADGNMEAWLVMEFCDKGTLRDLIRNGFFFVDIVEKEINMGCVIGTCQDIARGFQYLHEQCMIHGDLKPHNILLQTSSQDARGFIAKIADFGVSRKIQGSQMYTGTVGTMTYMPPELLGSSKISSKTDVYAFGLIMWELTTGEAPFGMVTVADIWRKVVIEHYRPSFASNVPPGYVNLATMCWDNDPKLRPTFDQVQNELTVLLAALK